MMSFGSGPIRILSSAPKMSRGRFKTAVIRKNQILGIYVSCLKISTVIFLVCGMKLILVSTYISLQKDFLANNLGDESH
jgi:hypothetical protein